MAPSIFISITILWLGHFLVDFMIGIWPVYKTMVELDLAIAGLIAASSAFVGEGLQVVFGSLSDRGFRKALIAFGIFFTVASSFFGLTQSYLILLLLFIMTCIGSGAFHPSAAALVGSLSEKRRALFMTIFSSGGAFGMALSQIAFSNLYLRLENLIFLIAIPSLILVLTLVAFGFFRREKNANLDIKPEAGFKKFKEFFSHRDLRNLYINQVCNQTIAWGAIFLLPDVLITRGFETNIAYGGGHLVFILGSALMMIPSGYLADKYSAKKVILYATLLGMFLFYAFLFAPHSSNIVTIILLGGMGASIGIVQPVALSLGTQISKNNPGMVSAFLMGLVWCVSETFGPAGGGMLTKFFETDAPAKALGIIGILFVISIFVAMRLPNLSKKEELISVVSQEAVAE